MVSAQTEIMADRLGFGDAVPVTTPGLLRQPVFRALWWARMVSFLGDGVSNTALVLLTSRHGPTALVIVLLANALPRFTGPIGGALADRWDRRTLMRGCAAGQAVIVAAIAVALPPLPVLAGLVAVKALLATAFSPSSASCVPQIVDSAQLTRANSLVGLGLNVQVAAGPALGGLLVGLGGSRTAFAVDAGTFIGSALLLGRLPSLRPIASPTSGIWTSTREGVLYVARSRALRSFVAGIVVFIAFAAIDNVALVFLVKGTLGGSATTYGLVQACFGLGMLAASISLGALRRTPTAASLIVTGASATAIGSLLTAAAPTLLTAAGAQAVAGTGNGVESVATSTFVQQLVPAPMLGRVFGAVGTSAQIGSSLAYAAGAPLVVGVGPRGAFTVAGVGAILGLLILLAGLHTANRPQISREQ
jgi:MFS family permease